MQDLKPGGGFRLSARYREHLTQSPNEKMEWETTKKKNKTTKPCDRVLFPSNWRPADARLTESTKQIHEGGHTTHTLPPFSSSKSWGNCKRQKVAKTKK